MSISVTVSGQESTSVVSTQPLNNTITVSGLTQDVTVTRSSENSATVTVSTGNPITVTSNFSNFVTGDVVRPDEISNFVTSSSLSDLNTATGVLNASINNLNTATGLLVEKSETGLFLTSGEINTNINNAVANLVDSAPSTLDTLNELAAALGDDENFAATTASSLGELSNATGILRTGILDLETATGSLKSDISSNDTDILNLQTATGLLVQKSETGNFITDLDTGAFYSISNPSGFITGVDLSDLQAATGNLNTRVIANESSITTVSGLIASNDSDISALQTATGLLVQKSETGNFVTDSDTGAFYVASNPSGFITGVDLSDLETATGLLNTATGVLNTNVLALQAVSGSFAQTGSSTFGILNVTGNVGIGTTSPQAKLHVSDDALLSGNLRVIGDMSLTGDATVSGDLTVTNNISLSGNIIDLNGNEIIQIQSNDIIFNGKHIQAHFGIGVRHDRGDVRGMDQGSTTSSDLGIYCNSIEGLSIQNDGDVIVNNGNLGIATTSPEAKLHVVGDTILSGNLDISGSITPAKDVAFDIGSPTKRFKDLYLSGDSIFLGETKLSISGDEIQTTKGGVVRRAQLRDNLNQTKNLIVTGNAVLGKVSLSANSFVTETGNFTVGLTHRGATVLLQNPSAIIITIPAQVSGHTTTFISETSNSVVFVSGVGMSGLNSFNGVSQMGGIYGQAQVIFKSSEYAFLGGNLI